MTTPFLVVEDVTARRRLFRAFGVSWSANRYAWMSPLSWAIPGFAMAFASRRDAGASRVLVEDLGYGAVLCAANILHSVGHIIAGRVVGAPVEAKLHGQVTERASGTLLTTEGGQVGLDAR